MPTAITATLEITGPTPATLRRAVPYAMTYALNRTAEEALIASRAVARRGLIIRAPQFIDNVFQLRRRADVRDYGTPAGLAVRFGLDARDFRGRASVIMDHEDGATRYARGTRNGFLYLPTWGTRLRPTVRDLLPRRWYPKALGLQDRRDVDGSTIAGRDRTPKRRGSTRGARREVKGFVIRDPRTGRGVLIARRIGRGRRMMGSRDMNLEVLFRLVERQEIRPRLQFRRTVAELVPRRLPANVDGMLAWALDRERQRGARVGEQAMRGRIPAPAMRLPRSLR